MPVKPLRILAISSALTVSMALAACQKAEAPTDSATTAAAVNGPDAKPGISASDGRLVLPVVAGRPAAVYFSVRNDGAGKATLAGVHIDGAGQAAMHQTQGGTMAAIETLDLAPGQQVTFAPGGYHVMAFELADTLKEGGTTEMTLTFSDGDKLSMPIRIETIAGEMDGMSHGGMAGMDH